MKKLILTIFLSLGVFGSEKIEINKNIVNLEVDEKNFIFNIKDVLTSNKTAISYPNKVVYSIKLKEGNGYSISYSEPETHDKLIELFKTYNMQI